MNCTREARCLGDTIGMVGIDSSMYVRMAWVLQMADSWYMYIRKCISGASYSSWDMLRSLQGRCDLKIGMSQESNFIDS